MTINLSHPVARISLFIVAVITPFGLAGAGIIQNFSLQIIAFLTAFYLLTHFISRKLKTGRPSLQVIDFFLFTFASLTVILVTGGLTSPLFYLLYFIIFTVALIFEPYDALIIAVTCSTLFLLSPAKNSLTELIELTSMILMAPLALLFGSYYRQLTESQEKIKMLQTEEQSLVKEVVDQEAEVKSWTINEFRQRLIKIWENLDAVAKDTNLASGSRQKITEISHQLSNLLKSGEEMEKKIEK